MKIIATICLSSFCVLLSEGHVSAVNYEAITVPYNHYVLVDFYNPAESLKELELDNPVADVFCNDGPVCYYARTGTTNGSLPYTYQIIRINADGSVTEGPFLDDSPYTMSVVGNLLCVHYCLWPTHHLASYDLASLNKINDVELPNDCKMSGGHIFAEATGTTARKADILEDGTLSSFVTMPERFVYPEKWKEIRGTNLFFNGGAVARADGSLLGFYNYPGSTTYQDEVNVCANDQFLIVSTGNYAYFYDIATMNFAGGITINRGNEQYVCTLRADEDRIVWLFRENVAGLGYVPAIGTQTIPDPFPTPPDRHAFSAKNRLDLSADPDSTVRLLNRDNLLVCTNDVLGIIDLDSLYGDRHIVRCSYPYYPDEASFVAQYDGDSPIFIGVDGTLLQLRPYENFDKLLYTGVSVSNPYPLANGTILVEEYYGRYLWISPDSGFIRSIPGSDSSGDFVAGVVGNDICLASGKIWRANAQTLKLELVSEGGDLPEGTTIYCVSESGRYRILHHSEDDTYSLCGPGDSETPLTGFSLIFNGRTIKTIGDTFFIKAAYNHAAAYVRINGPTGAITPLSCSAYSQPLFDANGPVSFDNDLFTPGSGILSVDALGGNVSENGWVHRQSSMGYYYRWEDWYYLDTMNMWMYAIADTPGSASTGAYAYTDELGWIWTSGRFLNYMYVYGKKTWMYVFTSRNKTHWFYDYRIQMPIQLALGPAPTYLNGFSIHKVPTQGDDLGTSNDYFSSATDSTSEDSEITIPLEYTWTRPNNKTITYIQTTDNFYYGGLLFSIRVTNTLTFNDETGGQYTTDSSILDKAQNKTQKYHESGNFRILSIKAARADPNLSH
jgi:hypothetical protein